METLLAQIKQGESRRKHIASELKRLDQAEQIAGFDLSGIETHLTNKLEDWRGLLTRHVQQARQILRVVAPTGHDRC
jgi:hypothetical protein